MTIESKSNVGLKIPDNATLPEIIELLNLVGLHFTPFLLDAAASKWIYDHKDWIVDGE